MKERTGAKDGGDAGGTSTPVDEERERSRVPWRETVYEEEFSSKPFFDRLSHFLDDASLRSRHSGCSATSGATMKSGTIVTGRFLKSG
jgi:hypothetical protein